MPQANLFKYEKAMPVKDAPHEVYCIWDYRKTKT